MDTLTIDVTQPGTSTDVGSSDATPTVGLSDESSSDDGLNLSEHVAPTEVCPLCWEPGWQRECEALARPDAFDLIVCCDCVYPSQPSDHLAQVILELLELNPRSTLLLAFERRPPPASAPAGTDHPSDFFARMAKACALERVPDEQLDQMWRYDEFELWTMRWRPGTQSTI